MLNFMSVVLEVRYYVFTYSQMTQGKKKREKGEANVEKS
jgi:hypothetical protein